MQIDTVTLTGTAVPVPTINGPTTAAVPFTASFTVDTQSGVQSFAFCGVNLCGFSASPLTVSNLSGMIGGAPQAMGAGGGAFGSGPLAGLFAGVNAGNLTWDFDEGTVGVAPTLASILAAAPADDAGQSTLNGYSLTVSTVSISDPPSSVPEPSVLALMLCGLAIALVWTLAGVYRSWRRTMRERPQEGFRLDEAPPPFAEKYKLKCWHPGCTAVVYDISQMKCWLHSWPEDGSS
jgi:hypothetical protein